MFKAFPAWQQGPLAADAITGCQFEERAYMIKLVKAVAFDRPRPQVIVYLDLKREECSRLFLSEGIYSRSFYLAGHRLHLMAFCEMHEDSKSYSFGLGLLCYPKCSKFVTLDYEIAARRNPSGKFVSLFNDEHTFDGVWAYGCRDLFLTPWSTLIADDNLFIDGLLHLRADVTLVGQPELQTYSES